LLKRILKKLGYFLPTLVIVSLVAFFLSKLAPGDPVAHYVPPIDALPSSSYSVTYYEKHWISYFFNGRTRLHPTTALIFSALRVNSFTLTKMPPSIVYLNNYQQNSLPLVKFLTANKLLRFYLFLSIKQ